MSDPMEDLMKMLSKPENMKKIEDLLGIVPDLHQGVNLLRQLRDSGMLDSILGILYIIASMKDILTDDMINGAGYMLNSSMELLSAMKEAEMDKKLKDIAGGISSGKYAGENEVTGAFGLMRQLKDPDVQKGITILMNILRTVGKS